MVIKKCNVILELVRKELYKKKFHGYASSMISIMASLIAIYMDEDINEVCYTDHKVYCCQDECLRFSSKSCCNSNVRCFWYYNDLHKKIFLKPENLDVDIQLYGKKLSSKEKKEYGSLLDHKDEAYAQISYIVDVLVLCIEQEAWELEKCPCKIECYEKMLFYLFFFNSDVCEQAVNDILDKRINNKAIKKAIQEWVDVIYMLKVTVKEKWSDVYFKLKNTRYLALAMNDNITENKKVTEENCIRLREFALKNLLRIRCWEKYSELLGVKGVRMLGIKRYLRLKKVLSE